MITITIMAVAVTKTNLLIALEVMEADMTMKRSILTDEAATTTAETKVAAMVKDAEDMETAETMVCPRMFCPLRLVLTCFSARMKDLPRRSRSRTRKALKAIVVMMTRSKRSIRSRVVPIVTTRNDTRRSKTLEIAMMKRSDIRRN